MNPFSDNEMASFDRAEMARQERDRWADRNRTDAERRRDLAQRLTPAECAESSVHAFLETVHEQAAPQRFAS